MSQKRTEEKFATAATVAVGSGRVEMEMKMEMENEGNSARSLPRSHLLRLRLIRLIG